MIMPMGDGKNPAAKKVAAAKKAVAATIVKKKKFVKAATQPAKPGTIKKLFPKKSTPASPIEAVTQPETSY